MMVYPNTDSLADRRDRGLLTHHRDAFVLARDDLRFNLDYRPGVPGWTAFLASLSAIEAILCIIG
jgi:hypothetical protein